LPSGFLSQASSTIGNGTQIGGLTINGGATSTELTIVGDTTNLPFQVQSGSNGFIVSADGTQFYPRVANTNWLGNGSNYFARVYANQLEIDSLNARGSTVSLEVPLLPSGSTATLGNTSNFYSHAYITGASSTLLSNTGTAYFGGTA